MEVSDGQLKGVKRITPPTLHEDFRGQYIELYNETLYREHGIPIHFVQDDMSVSSKHVLRGIHGDQKTWKLISCLAGRLYVVVVDCDERSPQFRQWEAFTISDQNRQQILVPPKHGIAHLVLTDYAIFHYKQSTYYERASQFSLLWNDPALAIWWPVSNPLVSRRDAGLEGP